MVIKNYAKPCIQSSTAIQNQAATAENLQDRAVGIGTELATVAAELAQGSTTVAAVTAVAATVTTITATAATVVAHGVAVLATAPRPGVGTIVETSVRSPAGLAAVAAAVAAVATATDSAAAFDVLRMGEN